MGNPIETFAASLNDEERALLHSSVTFVMRVVAKADSVVDRKEESAADTALKLARERLGEGFAGKPTDFPDATKNADNPDWPQSTYVRNLSGIVRRMPADARKIFDATMIEVALTIAGASGGILGFGEKLSVEEKYGIRRLIAGLDLQIEDAPIKQRLGY